MANEINIVLDSVTKTGLTLSAKVRQAGGTQEGSTVAMTEANAGFYTGDFSLAAVSDGVYSVEVTNDDDGSLLGTSELFVRNNAEATLPLVEQKSEADTRQSALIAEHDATQVDISNLTDATPAEIYTEFTSGSNEDAFKATGFSTPTQLVNVETTILNQIDGLNDVTSAEVYTYFTSLSRQDQFKADISGVASEANATANVATIVSEVNANETKIDTLTTNLATVDTNVDAIKVKTDANLDVAVSTRSDFDESTNQVTVATNNDKTGYSLSGTKTTLDSLNDLSAADVNAEVDTALADYDAPTKAELDSAVAPLATEVNATTNTTNIITEVDENETKIDSMKGIIDSMKRVDESTGDIFGTVINITKGV